MPFLFLWKCRETFLVSDRRPAGELLLHEHRPIKNEAHGRGHLRSSCAVQDCMSGTPIDYVDTTDVQYLSADIQLVSEHGRRHLRSSSYRTLAVPRTRTTLGDRSFAVTGPRVWSSLPATIRQITSYGQFRQHLETGAGNRSALRLLIVVRCTNTLTNLLTMTEDRR